MPQAEPDVAMMWFEGYAALFTLPERRHLVQILNFLVSPPPTSSFTLLRLMSQRRRVCRFEWLTALPVVGPLPQHSQCLDIRLTSLEEQSLVMVISQKREDYIIVT
jgi:hypothetical protein